MEHINLPVIALEDMTVLPDTVISLVLNDHMDILVVRDALKDNKRVFLTCMRDAMSINRYSYDNFYSTGCVCTVKQIIDVSDVMVRVTIRGERKALMCSYINSPGRRSGDIFIPDKPEAEDAIRERAELLEIKDLLRNYASINPKVNKEVAKRVLSINGLDQLMSEIMAKYATDNRRRQEFLEADNSSRRFEIVSSMLNLDAQVAKIREEIARKVRKDVDKGQRDYILREEMRVIGEELGDGDVQSVAEELSEKCENLQASEEIKERIRKELKRFKLLSPNSPEANVSRGYIETLLDLPWDKESEDNKDIDEARRVLDADHYGLNEVKERIVETLAVRNVSKKGDAPIICLAGPPGTGKTSIAQSVARALGRKYVRIALGGVHDEAEIRGHRRTYIGAMPGRIIQAIKEAGVKNPVVLLDEIDKVSSDNFHGDCSSALLEVLDAEQNVHFADHYIELPVDLSDCLFICTANDLSTVQRPLLDRMEIIELSGYTMNEKKHIAEEHLIPKQIEKNGLNVKKISFSDAAVEAMITGYTKEAGVRQLERTIAKVCRQIVRKLYTNNGELADRKVTVSERSLKDYLGKKKFLPEEVHKKDEVGVVNGLAWTSVGGTTLEIEVVTMPGNGTLKLTGQMGDVMQESAQIALSYVRSIVKGLPKDYFEKTGIHLHIPEGAVPKDGPSAGCTMVTALYSAITGAKVDAKSAMTGEVDLRGKVLAIGGLKEKLLAANAAGMKRVFVPAANKPDVEELDKEVVGDMEIVFVKEVKQILKQILVEK